MMKCPSCHAALPAPSPQCPFCSVDVGRLDLKFGAIPRHARFLTDLTKSLSRKSHREAGRQLRLFNRKFPQSRFSVFLTKQIPPNQISEYSFWLINRGRFGFIDAVRGQNFDLLLVIDVAQRAASLIIGYGLENYLNEHDLERALAGASSGFYQGNFGRGICNCVELIMNRMREVVKRMEESAAETHVPASEDATPLS